MRVSYPPVLRDSECTIPAVFAEKISFPSRFFPGQVGGCALFFFSEGTIPGELKGHRAQGRRILRHRSKSEWPSSIHRVWGEAPGQRADQDGGRVARRYRNSTKRLESWKAASWMSPASNLPTPTPHEISSRGAGCALLAGIVDKMRLHW